MIDVIARKFTDDRRWSAREELAHRAYPCRESRPPSDYVARYVCGLLIKLLEYFLRQAQVAAGIETDVEDQSTRPPGFNLAKEPLPKSSQVLIPSIIRAVELEVEHAASGQMLENIIGCRVSQVQRQPALILPQYVCGNAVGAFAPRREVPPRFYCSVAPRERHRSYGSTTRSAAARNADLDLFELPGHSEPTQRLGTGEGIGR